MKGERGLSMRIGPLKLHRQRLALAGVAEPLPVVEPDRQGFVVQFHHVLLEDIHADDAVLALQLRLDDQFLLRQRQPGKLHGHLRAAVHAHGGFGRSGAAAGGGGVHSDGGGHRRVDVEQRAAASGVQFAPERLRTVDTGWNPDLAIVVEKGGDSNGLAGEAAKL